MGQQLRLRDDLTERASRVFIGPLADISVNDNGIHVRLTEIRRALIAHDALCTMLAEVGVPMPIGKLVDAIAKAYELGMISGREEHWLRYFNRKANEAKHHGLPF
jgi:hypothetical protein